MNVYPLDLGATEAQQTTIAAVAMLPCTFKILFGFASDQLPLFGYRRKGYMWIGWSISTIVMAALLLKKDLTMNWHEDGTVTIPENAPSIQQLSLSFLIFGIGFWLADVMGDSIVVSIIQAAVFCGHVGTRSSAQTMVLSQYRPNEPNWNLHPYEDSYSLHVTHTVSSA